MTLNLISDLGAIGDGVLHPLSERYATLQDAQIVYPDATSLDESIDGAALQKGLFAGARIYAPPGRYILNRSIRVRDTFFLSGDNDGKTAATDIWGDASLGALPMFHRDGGYIGLDGISRDNDGSVASGAEPGGCVVDLERVRFRHFGAAHAGVVMLIRASPTSSVRNCFFNHGDGRGFAATKAFSLLIDSCAFNPSYATNETIDADALSRPALYVPGHSTVISCDFASCGLAIKAVGAASNVFGCRIETCTYGVVLGGEGLLWGQQPVFGFSRSVVSGLSFENNKYSIIINSLARATLQAIGIQGYDDPGRILSVSGVVINARLNDAVTIENVSAGGDFQRAAVVHTQPCATRFKDLQARNEIGPDTVGLSSIFSTLNTGTTPDEWEFDGVNRSTKVNVCAHQAMRGLTGWAMDSQTVFCKKLGGKVEIQAGAMSAVVTFKGGISIGQASFAGGFPKAIADPASSLPPGSYQYATTLINEAGETGGAENQTLKGVDIGTSEKALMAFNDRPDANLRRVYRCCGGVWEGYFEFDAAILTFEDIGQAVDGRDEPPGGTQVIPSQHEDDPNYDILLSPSWMTMCRVTNKTTVGFTLEFGIPAPSSASASWLMFRT